MTEQAAADFLTRLLKRMDQHPGFAGLSATAPCVLQLASQDFNDTHEITVAILNDASFTAELLRLSNSSHNLRGGRSITTVDQAIIILGLNTVENLAATILPLNARTTPYQHKLLQAEIIAACFCGLFCAEITHLYAPRLSAQEAQVCGLLQNLGRLMSLYHCFDDIARSQALQAEQNLTEAEAVEQSIGMRFEDIGAAIAEHWQLPELLQQSLSLQIGKMPPRVAASAIEWHRHCALFARRTTDTLFRLARNRERIELAKDIEFFRNALHLHEDEVRAAITKCLAETGQLLPRFDSTCSLEQARDQLRKASERVLDRLAPWDSLTRKNLLVNGRAPVEILQQVLRKFHDACGFDRTLLCLPDGSSGLVAVAGVGRNTGQIASKFRSHGKKPDIFRLAMNSKLDLYVADISSPGITPHIPDWYPQLISAKSFMLLSLSYEHHPLGLIYGDYTEAHPESPLDSLPPEQIREWREELEYALHAGALKALQA